MATSTPAATCARWPGCSASTSAPLLAAYDERYADAPINPRRVFEAELATGANGSIRGTRGGPNWSVLVAAVMALVLAWSIARLVMDTPPELRGATPVLNGSGGPQGAGTAPLADPVAVVVSAASGGAHVVVRDGAGRAGLHRQPRLRPDPRAQVSPPVRVQSTDGAVTVRWPAATSARSASPASPVRAPSSPTEPARSPAIPGQPGIAEVVGPCTA